MMNIKISTLIACLMLTSNFTGNGLNIIQGDDKPTTQKSTDPKNKAQNKLITIRTGGAVELTEISQDSSMLATSGKGKVAIWDIKTGKLIDVCKQEKPDDLIHGPLIFSPDQQKLAFSHQRPPHLGYTRTIEIWDIKTKKVSKTITDLPSAVVAVEFSKDGKRLAASISVGGGQIMIWDLESEKEPVTINGTDFITNLTFHHQHGNFLVGAGIGGIHCWDSMTGEEVAKFSDPKINYEGLAILEDGIKIASVNGQLALFDLNLGTSNSIKEVNSYPLGNLDIGLGTALGFSGDGKRIAIASKNKVHLWDVVAAKEVLVKTLPGKKIESVTLSKDGKLLAAGTATGEVELWNIDK